MVCGTLNNKSKGGGVNLFVPIFWLIFWHCWSYHTQCHHREELECWCCHSWIPRPTKKEKCNIAIKFRPRHESSCSLQDAGLLPRGLVCRKPHCCPWLPEQRKWKAHWPKCLWSRSPQQSWRWDHCGLPLWTPPFLTEAYFSTFGPCSVNMIMLSLAWWNNVCRPPLKIDISFLNQDEAHIGSEDQIFN